jgi:hypothetical protein
VDESDLLDLFARLVREEFGLTLPETIQHPAIDPRLEALLDFSDDADPVSPKKGPGS